VVFRLAFVSKSALASLLVASYVAVLGLMGLAGGFIADRVSSHVGKSAAKLASPLRPDSRVERWLKAQTVSYAIADVRALDVFMPDGVGSGREIPPVAVLAAAMDRSEQSDLPEARLTVPVVARITAPVHQRRNFAEVCKTGSCEAVIRTRLAKSRTTNSRVATKALGIKNSHQLAKLNAKSKRNAGVSVATLVPADGKMGLGLRPSLGTAKAFTKTPYRVWRNLHLADTPAEIIHRSLGGTS
jgi:hypothetical protein